MNIEEKTGELLRSQGLTLSTAESCTGGGVAALVTSVPGSSEYFKGGIVAYANEVKESLLGVSPHTLEKHGAVSQETVVEMVQGVMKSMKTDCAIATSGIAGPGGGSLEKPVGTIWMAVACKGEITTLKEEGDLGRAQNVQRTIRDALGLLCKELEKAKDTKNSLPTSASQQTYLRETRHHPHEKSNRQDV